MTSTEESFKVTVSTWDASHVRSLLAARVRLTVVEKRTWLFNTTFTVSGPADVVKAAEAEFYNWREKEWWASAR